MLHCKTLPTIHVRSLSFQTDCSINHWTWTYIIGSITSLKGLALRFGSDTDSEANLLNWTWTPEQRNLSWLWKQMKKLTGTECSSWILDIWLLSEPQTVHTKQRERVRLNCQGKKKKKSEIRTGRWECRLMSDLQSATPPPVWIAFLMARPFNPSDCNCQHVKSALCVDRF